MQNDVSSIALLFFFPCSCAQLFIFKLTFTVLHFLMKKTQVFNLKARGCKLYIGFVLGQGVTFVTKLVDSLF